MRTVAGCTNSSLSQLRRVLPPLRDRRTARPHRCTVRHPRARLVLCSPGSRLQPKLSIFTPLKLDLLNLSLTHAFAPFALCLLRRRATLTERPDVRLRGNISWAADGLIFALAMPRRGQRRVRPSVLFVLDDLLGQLARDSVFATAHCAFAA